MSTITYKTIKSVSGNNSASIITDLTLSAPNNHKTIIVSGNDPINFNTLPKRFNVIHLTGELGNYQGFLNCYKRS